jgi:hypothetical protein
MSFALASYIQMDARIFFFALCLYSAMFSSAFSKPVLNPDDPIGFFTTVADKMLQNTFNFGVSNIPVYSNGVFAYTPSVHRLLQLSANIYEASTTNYYPTVFRPIFEMDNLGNIFIIGYTNLISAAGSNSVSGLGDPQLASPYDIASLSNFPNCAPIADFNGLVNVYGVPWIIGAKKGLPNFNEFSMQDVVKVTRKLQVTRPSTNSLPTATNQMYVVSITNSMGVEFWNSYSNSYSNQVQVVVNDNLAVRIMLTNGTVLFSDGQSLGQNYLLCQQTNLSGWPANSFLIPFGTNFTILPDSAYSFSSSQFYYLGGNPTYQATTPTFAPLPQILLQVTNYLQAFILENNHVIDYVHFAGPGSTRNLTSEFQNTNTTAGGGGTAPYYTNLIWSTALDNSGLSLGVLTQIGISAGTIGLNTIFWKDPNAHAEIDGFRHFLNPQNASIYGTQNNFMYSTNLAVQVPYTPSAITYEYDTFQANDPLVHYLKSDLNYFGHEPADPNSLLQTGVHAQDLSAANFSQLPNLGKLNARYLPWGKTFSIGETDEYGVKISAANINQNAYDLSFKDPLMTGSDNWDFPIKGNLPLTTLGQIHRGTPWQTVYLKASDILPETVMIGSLNSNIGTNTWVIWTGNSNISDAELTAPISDRRLLGFLIPLMDTNAPEQLLSVNDSSLAAWSAVLGGLIAITNTTILSTFYHPATNSYSWLTIDPASPAVGQLVVAINSKRAVFTSADGLVGTFESIGDILSTQEITEHSPFLNWNDVNQQKYGISDEVYEAIPAQLLPLLRPDSVGKMIQENGSWNIQFSGSDGFDYELQTSTNLVNWNSVGTFHPVQGHFSLPISPVSNLQEQFYRSILLP